MVQVRSHVGRPSALPIPGNGVVGVDFVACCQWARFRISDDDALTEKGVGVHSIACPIVRAVVGPAHLRSGAVFQWWRITQDLLYRNVFDYQRA